ncbi:MAG: hypothetical protein M3R24_18635 [Chloroflexota bacterium]|nr:hypothetical protein [Chloroflexota bacterium]
MQDTLLHKILANPGLDMAQAGHRVLGTLGSRLNMRLWLDVYDAGAYYGADTQPEKGVTVSSARFHIGFIDHLVSDCYNRHAY